MNFDSKSVIIAMSLFMTALTPEIGAIDHTQAASLSDGAVVNSDVVYDRVSMIDTAERFFGDAASGIAEALENTIENNGLPVGYIAGDEVGAAYLAGVRYGSGIFSYKDSDGLEHSRELYWQGPSAGYDFGVNASKVMYLVYDLDEADSIYQRFPAVDGNIYLGA
jgi:hypothetical protein